MAIVNFANLGECRPSPPALDERLGPRQHPPWRKVQPISTDGTSNMFVLLNAAKATGRTVSGSYDNTTGQLYTLYLN